MRIGSVFVIACVLSALAGTANANLIVNGDFETTDGRIGLVNGKALNNLNSPGSTWDVYDAIPGWTSSYPTDAGIEIQYSGTVIQAHSGNHYVELDSHPGPNSNSDMTQSVFLNPGLYELSYFYSPRTNNNGDNGIEVLLSGLGLLFTSDGNSQGWVEQLVQFSIDVAGSYDLTFRAIGTENTLGGFLDDVSLHAVVPEPASLIVWSLVATVGVVVCRVRSRRK